MAPNIDDFLNHRQSTRTFDKTPRLKWTDKGYCNFFLHTKAPIIALWQHQIPTVVEIKRDGRPSREVWFTKYNCLEPEPTLQKQNKKDENGSRLYPPEVCPVCKLLNWLNEALLDPRCPFDWTDTLFTFEGDDPNKKVTRRVGGVINLFSGDNLSTDQETQLREAGIYRKEAWKENALSKLNYLFRGVDADNLAAGVQIATETAQLGEKVRVVIFDERKSKGDEAGNPLLHPYCIRFEYNPNEREISKKYHALRYDRIPPSPQILSLIRDTPLPDVSKDIAKLDPSILGPMLERACNPEIRKFIPWDQLFGGSKRQESPPPTTTPQQPAKRQAKPPPAPPPATRVIPQEDQVACDYCNNVISIKDPKCEHCGQEYEIEQPPVPPPPPIPSRQQMKAQQAKQAPPAPPPAFVPPAEDGSDDMPF